MSNENSSIKNSTCFLISPMGAPGSPTRIFADKVKSFLNNEVVYPLGYALYRSDEINETGMIRDDMITHILDDEVAITLLDYQNVNVYYELAVRHASRKVCFVIMSEEDRKAHRPPFDAGEVRILTFPRDDMENYIPGKLTPALDKFRATLSHDMTSFNREKIQNPIIHARQNFVMPEGVSAAEILNNVDTKLHQFEDYLGDRVSKIVSQMDKLEPDKIMDTLNEINDKGIATYIDGEDPAFEKLAEATESAKVSLRTSRFAPQAISDTDSKIKDRFFDALCLFGKEKGVECKRIMCMNEPRKRRDLWNTISRTCGGSMKLYLTNRENNFELVVVDNSAAFLHFYDDARRIKSTLFVKGQPVIAEFTKIYDRMLIDDFYNFQVIDCSKHEFVYEFTDEVNEALANLDRKG